MIIASVTTKYSNIANVYGGGGKLFGGSYLICIYIGMLIGKYYKQLLSLVNKINSLVLASLFTIGAVVIWHMMCTQGLLFDVSGVFGVGFNPPGFCFMSYALFIMFSIFLWDRFFTQIGFNKLDWLFNVLAYVGTNTLYIFLYHRLFLDYYLGIYCEQMPIEIKRITYYVIMVVGSIVVGTILKYLKSVIRNSYNYSEH